MITARDLDDAVKALQSDEDFTFEISTPAGRRGILKRFSAGGNVEAIYLQWIDQEVSAEDSRQAEILITALLRIAGGEPGPAIRGKNLDALDRQLRAIVGGGVG